MAKIGHGDRTERLPMSWQQFIIIIFICHIFFYKQVVRYIVHNISYNFIV